MGRGRNQRPPQLRTHDRSEPRVSHVSATGRYARHARFYPSVLVAECEEAGLSAARDKFWLARTSDDWRVAMKRLGGLLPRVVIV